MPKTIEQPDQIQHDSARAEVDLEVIADVQGHWRSLSYMTFVPPVVGFAPIFLWFFLNGPGGILGMFLLGAAGSITSWILMKRWAGRGKQIMERAAELDGHMNVGVLLDVTLMDKTASKIRAEYKLAELLPTITAQDCNRFEQRHHLALESLLGSTSTKVVIASLSALKHIGEKRSIPKIRRAIRHVDSQVAKAAGTCLESILSRVEALSPETTLLRASDSLDMEPYLLRPATEGRPSDEKILLRPTVNKEPED